MPSKKVNPIDRLRCIRACESCQRRKQRCDGEQPCGRCRSRSLARQCNFPNKYRNPESLSLPSHQHQHQHQHQHLPQNQPAEDVSAAKILIAGHDTITRRRSESSPVSKSTPPVHIGHVHRSPRALQDASECTAAAGELSNISFIKHIRGLVRSSNGSCAFADNARWPLLLDDYQMDVGNWMHSSVAPGTPTMADAILLVRRYIWTTSGLVDLFNEPVLLGHLLAWYEDDNEDVFTRATLYLVWAIGLQASPDGDDGLAHRYFQHGRYLAAAHRSEDTTVASIQCDVLITWFLLGAGQRNAAYVQLGTAIRAAYVLDLHISDRAALFDCQELDSRERLWKAICILDGFMTAALGKPSSVRYDAHEPKINGRYSSSYDLCLIFMDIQRRVYTGREISDDVVVNIAAQHRRWSSLFQQGIETDGISSASFLEGDGTPWPNIGLYHLKEAYDWSILFLTLPFLVDFVSKRVLDRGPGQDSRPSSLSLPVHTCVSTAIGTLEMLEKLFKGRMLPRRLPFVVNSAFISAITLGISIFGDLDEHFPLQSHLRTAQLLLCRLGTNDPISLEASATLADLRTACDVHLAKRRRQRMEQRASQFAGLFGDLGPRKISKQAGFEDAVVQGQHQIKATSPTRGEKPLIDVDDSRDTEAMPTIDEHLILTPAQSSNVENTSGSQKMSEFEVFDVGFQSSHSTIPVDSSSGSLYFGSFKGDMPIFPLTDADYMVDMNVRWELESIFPEI